ncbi:transmembrane protein 213 [Chionomys nivalis]|uniref:transmembrane protein 213 n=1 Tax=Chionomys nivalis TaxID=269649 RepID=UPI0025997586|nr:transmembrane protein 213 [Chionomys nivalis]
MITFSRASSERDCIHHFLTGLTVCENTVCRYQDPGSPTRGTPCTNMAQTGVSLCSPGYLTSASQATLLFSLVLASFHLSCCTEASSGNSTLSIYHPDPGTLEQCANVDFCPLASLCCRASVDEYGWIAAAVGWSLWFLTLILLCVDKLMKLAPEEPKDLAA